MAYADIGNQRPADLHYRRNKTWKKSSGSDCGVRGLWDQVTFRSGGRAKGSLTKCLLKRKSAVLSPNQFSLLEIFILQGLVALSKRKRKEGQHSDPVGCHHLFTIVSFVQNKHWFMFFSQDNKERLFFNVSFLIHCPTLLSTWPSWCLLPNTFWPAGSIRNSKPRTKPAWKELVRSWCVGDVIGRTWSQGV